MPPTPAVTSARNRAVALKKHHPEGGEAVDAAMRELRELTLTEHIQRVLAQAPPLSDEQRARIAALLRSGGE